MSETSHAYRQLAEVLRRRLAIIADQEFYRRNPKAHFDQLQANSGEITKLTEQLPAPIDPQLTHYLQRCSYEKALAFLETR